MSATRSAVPRRLSDIQELWATEIELLEGKRTILATQVQIEADLCHALDLLSLLVLFPALTPPTSTPPSSPNSSTDSAPLDAAKH